MTHYANHANHVRVDFYHVDDHGRPYKWYLTEAVPWLTYSYDDGRGKLIHEAFGEALIAHLRKEDGRIRLGGMLAVCAEPYYDNACPICLMVPNICLTVPNP